MSDRSTDRSCSRRDFLSWTTSGLGGVALATLLNDDGLLRAAGAEGAKQALAGRSAKAKRVIHLFLAGGLSHIDSFDYKPELILQHGQSMTTKERPDVFFGEVGLLHRPFWEFKQRGKSGLWISELFPNLAEQADELTVIRSMVAETGNHVPACFQANTGFRQNGFPAMGSWISYALGRESENLPAFVALPDSRGLPAGGSTNWTNGFLPAAHQGISLRTNGPAIANLAPARPISEETELANRGLLAELNRRHAEIRPEIDQDNLSARAASYELAARMQLAVPDAVNLDSEPASIRQMYGLEDCDTADFGKSCLLARRLLEKGVRFVQLISGGAFGTPVINWDGHHDMQTHASEARRIDRPVAALLADLRRRGMMDDTLVLCTTEFGRTPFTQSADGVLGKGRDHNQRGFTVWMAGAGLKKGLAYGATDEVGYEAVENRVTWPDFHATVLRLLGIDHEELTFYHNGSERRLTNVSGQAINGILT